jgi:transcriptional regulator with XRE-family HTH domain
MAAMRSKSLDAHGIAASAGIDEDTVTAFLNTKRWPSLRSRMAMEGALGLPLGELQRAYDGSGPDEGSELSAESVTVTDVQQGDRQYVRIAAQAVGWELTASYTDADDRRTALADIAEAWRHIMGGTGDGGSSAGDSP